MKMEEINNAVSDIHQDNTRIAGGSGTQRANNGNIARKEHFILLAGAILLGILGNILLYENEPGISIPVFVIAFYGILFASCGRELKFKPDLPWALSIPVLLLSLTYLFYSNTFFRILNLLAIPLLIVVQTVLITGNNTYSWHTLSFLVDIVYGFFYRVFAFIFKPVKVLASLLPSKARKPGGGVVGKVFLGLLISVPLLIVVVSLLGSADKIFESYMNRIPDIFEGIDLGEFFGRAVFFLVIFAAAFSFIYSLIEKKRPEASVEGDGSISLPKIWDKVVVITVMAIVNVIYLMFVIIQFAYLFGGADLAAASYTYSEYARRGFFELITVTVINFGIMLASVGFTKMDSGPASRFLRSLYSLLVGNTAVMLVSAYYRMLLYEDAYGFTDLRILTQAFMIFLLVLFGISLLRVWRDGFSLAKPFIIAAVAAFVIINYVNIDALIAGNNLERYSKTQKIDVNYLSLLSYDALPEIARFKVMDNDKVAAEIAELLKFKSEEAKRNTGWQSFNISRYRAGRVVNP